jgi:hypothetical protein
VSGNPDLRAAIAAVLSTVDGVNGFAKMPSAARTGDGWPWWGGAERFDGAGPMITTWRIMVLLPANDESAVDEWISARLDDLTAALSRIVFVLQVDPVNLTSGSPALQFTCRE